MGFQELHPSCFSTSTSPVFTTGVLFRLVWFKIDGTGFDGVSSIFQGSPSIFPKKKDNTYGVFTPFFRRKEGPAAPDLHQGGPAGLHGRRGRAPAPSMAMDRPPLAIRAVGLTREVRLIFGDPHHSKRGGPTEKKKSEAPGFGGHVGFLSKGLPSLLKDMCKWTLRLVPRSAVFGTTGFVIQVIDEIPFGHLNGATGRVSFSF